MDKLKTQNTLTDFLSTTVQAWVDSTAAMGKHVFEEDPLLSYYAIVGGKSWDPNPKVSALDVTKQVQLALYAYTIPVAWKLDTDHEIGAFVMCVFPASST
jgi:hypothetical protein